MLKRLQEFKGLPPVNKSEENDLNKNFHQKYPNNKYEMIIMYGNIWWASRHPVTGYELQEVMKFIQEVLKRDYIVINTGGHGAKNGQNPATNKRYVDKNLAIDDRRSAT